MNHWPAIKKAVVSHYKNPSTRYGIGAMTIAGAALGSFFGKEGVGAGIGFLGATLSELKHLHQKYKAYMKEGLMAAGITTPGKKRWIPRGYGSIQQKKTVRAGGITIGSHNLIGGKQSFFQRHIRANRPNNQIRRKLLRQTFI